MQIVAIHNFHFGLGNSAEILQRGDTFSPPGTGPMNAIEQAQSLIRNGCACLPEDWPNRQAKTEPGHEWAAAEVDRMNRLSDQASARRR